MRPPWRQPDARESLSPATVLLASTGRPFSDAAIVRAAELAAGSRVRVVTVAKIHGSAFGLQHPGLMPNKKERDQAQAIVTTAIEALHRAGIRADGEVVITRSPGRSFARAARAARDVRHVVIDDPRGARLRRIETWAAGQYVRFRLRDRAGSEREKQGRAEQDDHGGREVDAERGRLGAAVAEHDHGVA